MASCSAPQGDWNVLGVLCIRVFQVRTGQRGRQGGISNGPEGRSLRALLKSAAKLVPLHPPVPRCRPDSGCSQDPILSAKSEGEDQPSSSLRLAAANTDSKTSE